MSLFYICRPRNYKKGHKRGMMRLGKKGKVIESMRLLGLGEDKCGAMVKEG